MKDLLKHTLLPRWWVFALLTLLAGYWRLPISGQVIVLSGDGTEALAWPRMQLDAPLPASPAWYARLFNSYGEPAATPTTPCASPWKRSLSTKEFAVSN